MKKAAVVVIILFICSILLFINDYFGKDIKQSIPYTVNEFKFNNKLNTYKEYNCNSYEIKGKVICSDDYGYLKNKEGKSYIA